MYIKKEVDLFGKVKNRNVVYCIIRYQYIITTIIIIIILSFISTDI